jgi:putative transcriptional regulator
MANDFKLTNEIRRLRFEHGEMTQEELARRVGVTRQTIIAIESGKYAPSLPLAMRLAGVFDRSVEQVFTLTPARNGRSQREELPALGKNRRE